MSRQVGWTSGSGGYNDGTNPPACGQNSSCNPPPSGCGSNCKPVTPTCSTVYACTNVYPEAIGEGHHACNDPTACVYGDNPNGLFQFLSGAGRGAEYLILEGAAGIQWLLGLLDAFENEVIHAFDQEIAGYTTLLATGIGAFFIPGLEPGGGIAAITAAVQLSRLNNLETAFKHSFDHFSGELTDLLRVAPSAEIMVTATDSAGQEYDWTTQSLNVAFVWTPTSP